MGTVDLISSSFRDPSGFLYYKKGHLFRQVNSKYKDDYDHLINSGLYQALVGQVLLIPHQEVKEEPAVQDMAYKVIKPERIPFISYPYEWCFSQLKDAALTTLKIQKIVFEYGMSLKDSSAYNIQFWQGKPVMIDTLSFERYKEGMPWVAYRQYCQHFLSPLALMAYKDSRFNQLLRLYIDGIPLDLTSKLLPKRTYFKFSFLSHIHLHAKSQEHFADKSVEAKTRKMSSQSFRALIDNLEATTRRIKWRPPNTEWGSYYKDTNYSNESFNLKKEIIADYLERIKPKTLWDLGSNTGEFSRIASQKNIQTISFDIDQVAVEKNYLQMVEKKELNVLPLLLDLTNPSPDIGWQNNERISLLKRGPVEAVMALALIHHLAISNNLPLTMIADFFNSICQYLIIEFVPKSDSQVKRLLTTREDIFPDYKQDFFENEFGKYFVIKSVDKLGDSERTLYLMQRK